MIKRDLTASSQLLSIAGKKILITGGLGFIGSNLAYRCLELGAQVTVYDNLDPHAGGNLYNVFEISKEIDIRYHDILDFDRLVELIVGKDIIFNCAASTSHPFSMREPWFDLDVNSRGVINLLEAIRRFNHDVKFVHLGTSTQLGRLHYQPADENHPEFPLDVYSANKCVSEKYVLVYAHAYGLRSTVIRLSNVYGPRASIHSPEFSFNNYFIGLALQDREIQIFGDGKQKRNLIYVLDAVEALIYAALDDCTNGEPLFAVSDEHYSVAEVAEIIVNVIKNGSIRFIPWPPGRRSTDVGDAVISNNKIKQLLDWQPRMDLNSGIKFTRDFYSDCLGKYLK